MEDVLLLSSFIATGAAWGMTWAAGFGVLKKDMCSVSLLKIIALTFTIAGSICAAHYLHGLYEQYSSEELVDQEYIKQFLAGQNLFINGGRLLILISPLLLIIPPLRKSKFVCAIVGLCYVLLPFYDVIVAKFTS